MEMPAPSHSSTVDEAEIAKFSRLAADWWDPNGENSALHRFNPVRLAFLRETCTRHFERPKRALTPFVGLKLLDVGCGGGLLSEPLARMGFDVLGIDPAKENIKVASEHARASSLSVDYRVGSAEALVRENRKFDCVIAMEVIEHVSDMAAFVDACASLTARGGLLIMATINRTLKSFALAKIGAEYLLRWLPIGTHDWSRFITPDELSREIERADLDVVQIQGVRFDPLQWEWQLSRDADVNYMLVAQMPTLITERT